MRTRSQRTIGREAAVGGIGFLSGAQVTLRFLPAEPGQGICFVRTDLAPELPIPALVEYTVPRQRRTALERRGVAIEMIEHVMAALAGLWIDNYRVEIDGPEPPGCDGSSLQFVEALLQAGIVEQGVWRRCLALNRPIWARGDDGSCVLGRPCGQPGLVIGYWLDYGENSPIPAQHVTIEVTPERFVNEIAMARTFLLQSEAAALLAQGYGQRLTARDLLIFGPQGVIDNTLRAPDECARHKILDLIGDLALAGCDLCGSIEARRSGHFLNAEFVRRARLAHSAEYVATVAHRAA